GRRLERPAEPPPALPRVFRDAALLPAIAREKHHDPVRFTELIRPQNQRVGGVKRHPEAGPNCTTNRRDDPDRYPTARSRLRAIRPSRERGDRGTLSYRKSAPAPPVPRSRSS